MSRILTRRVKRWTSLVGDASSSKIRNAAAFQVPSTDIHSIRHLPCVPLLIFCLDGFQKEKSVYSLYEAFLLGS